MPDQNELVAYQLAKSGIQAYAANAAAAAGVAGAAFAIPAFGAIIAYMVADYFEPDPAENDFIATVAIDEGQASAVNFVKSPRADYSTLWVAMEQQGRAFASLSRDLGFATGSTLLQVGCLNRNEYLVSTGAWSRSGMGVKSVGGAMARALFARLVNCPSIYPEIDTIAHRYRGSFPAGMGALTIAVEEITATYKAMYNALGESVKRMAIETVTGHDVEQETRARVGALAGAWDAHSAALQEIARANSNTEVFGVFDPPWPNTWVTGAALTPMSEAEALAFLASEPSGVYGRIVRDGAMVERVGDDYGTYVRGWWIKPGCEDVTVPRDLESGASYKPPTHFVVTGDYGGF